MIKRGDLSELQQQFADNSPFPFIVIDDFLEEDALHDLIVGLAQEQFHLKESDLFTFYQTNDLVSTEVPQLKKVYGFFKSNECIDQFKQLTGIDLAYNQLDLQGSTYADTHHLLCHDDQLEGRKLAFILYLSDLNEEEGGALTLFSTNEEQLPEKVVKKIMSKTNRLVCFQVSDISFHEVEEVLKPVQRLALGGWYH